MKGPDEVPLPLQWQGGSWRSKVATSAISVFGRWPGPTWQPAAGASLSGAASALWPGPAISTTTAAEQASGPIETGAAGLGITEWTMGSSVVVAVAGEIDIATTDQLSAALGGALRRSPRGLICDLSDVGFMGAAGLTVLLFARAEAHSRQAWFDLVCPRPQLRRVIALGGLDAVFSLHHHLAAAATAQGLRAGRP